MPKPHADIAERRWTNDTGEYRWQRRVRFVNSCARCISYHGVIHKGDIPLPQLHANCACVDIPLPPGAESTGYPEVEDIWRDLPAEQKRAAVGKNFARLVDKGVLDFDDALVRAGSRGNSYRVKTLTEALADKNIKAGDAARYLDKGAATRLQNAQETARKIVEREAPKLARLAREISQYDESLIRQILEERVAPRFLDGVLNATISVEDAWVAEFGPEVAKRIIDGAITVEQARAAAQGAVGR